jgi:predicted DNA-binding ribbon-helix-helix protein
MHIAAIRQLTVTALAEQADAERREGRSLASALRVHALQAVLPQPPTSVSPSDQ